MSSTVENTSQVEDCREPKKLKSLTLRYYDHTEYRGFLPEAHKDSKKPVTRIFDGKIASVLFALIKAGDWGVHKSELSGSIPARLLQFGFFIEEFAGYDDDEFCKKPSWRRLYDAARIEIIAIEHE